MNLLTQMETET